MYRPINTGYSRGWHNEGFIGFAVFWIWFGLWFGLWFGAMSAGYLFVAFLFGGVGERRKVQRKRQKSVPIDLLADAADHWRGIVSNLENLNQYAKPDEMESARAALREMIGEVTVVEDDTGVIVYAKLSNDAVYKTGAENTAPELYIEPIRLR